MAQERALVSGPALDEYMASLWGKFAATNDGQSRGFTAVEGLTGLYDARFFPTTFRRYGPVEYFSPIARKCSTYDRCQQRWGMVKKACPESFRRVRPARPQPF